MNVNNNAYGINQFMIVCSSVSPSLELNLELSRGSRTDLEAKN
jgi:hypothetical protein